LFLLPILVTILKNMNDEHTIHIFKWIYGEYHLSIYESIASRTVIAISLLVFISTKLEILLKNISIMLKLNHNKYLIIINIQWKFIALSFISIKILLILIRIFDININVELNKNLLDFNKMCRFFNL
jgi:hypothetical protein